MSPRPYDLWFVRALTLGPVALAFPVATLAVFWWGADREATADLLALVYSCGLFLGFSSSLWPLSGLRGWTWRVRVQSLCLLFLVVSALTHLSWEFFWLLFHELLARSRDAAWAYPWWAYIDGGDLRYAAPSSTLLMIETLSVLNGWVIATGLWFWYRSGGRDRRAPLLFMVTATVHLYSTALYFGSEILDGLPNVDTSSWLDTWIKFGLANASWIVFPWFVLYWSQDQLRRLPGADECEAQGV